MEQELAVNSAHAFSLCQYLGFARSERGARISSVHEVFDAEKKKLKDPHYTKEEVIKILGAVSNSIDVEMSKEFVNMAHNTFLLIRQLMRQAETGGITVKMNLSEIQNVELLRAVAQFEKEISEKKAERTATILKDPSLLDDSIKNLSSDFVSEFYRNDIMNLSEAFQKNALEHNLSVSELKQRMQAKDQELNRHEQFRKEEQDRIKDMENRHFQMQKKIDDIANQLAMKEAELEKKFQSTNTYLNMQKILQSKNAMIQKFREGKGMPAEEDDD